MPTTSLLQFPPSRSPSIAELGWSTMGTNPATERIAAHSCAQGRILCADSSLEAHGGRFPGQWAVESDTGLSRAHNEDSWLASPNGRLLLLADGMGGYNAGEVASQIAVNCIASSLGAEVFADGQVDACSRRLIEAIGFANQAIRNAATLRPECLGMGTTIVAAWQIATSRWLIAHVGDSRAYLCTRDGLKRLTSDHSIGQAMLDSGAMTAHQLRAYPMRGVLTRALGVELEVRPDVSIVNLEPGQGLLLCSDGLSDLVAESLMHRVIGQHQGSPERQVSALVNLALQAGGLDNITAVLICA